VSQAEADAQIATDTDLTPGCLGFSYGAFRQFPGVWTNAVDGVKWKAGLFGAGHANGVVGHTRAEAQGNHGAAYAWRNGSFQFLGFPMGMSTNFPPYQRGATGHALAVGDVNADGIDEICDKRVDTPRFANGAWSLDLRWSLMSMRSYGPSLFTAATNNNMHWDDIAIGDFVDAHLDGQGHLIPMPGVEVVATADDRSPQGDRLDWHGPALWNGVMGHDFASLLATPQRTARSPLRFVNTAGSTNHDGEQYPFPSFASWSQPHATSQWADVAALLAGSGSTPATVNQANPDLQLVYFGNLIADQPGFELGGNFKNGQAYSYQSQGPFFLFGSSPHLPALAWGFDGDTGPLPGVPSRYVADIVGDRSAQEILNTFSQPSTLTGFVGNGSTPGQPRYRASRLLTLGYAHSQAFAADILGDGAEEVFQIYFGTWPSVRITKGLGSARTHASPNAYAEPFLDALRQNPIDFERLDGLRFVSRHLIHGRTGVPYGVPLDDAIDPTAGPLFGHVLVPEGGNPLLSTTGSRYTVQLLTPLPAGLTGTFLPGNAAQRRHKGVFLLHGTPMEACWRELEFRIVDNATNAQATVLRWLHVAAGPGAMPDTAPRIEAVRTSRSVLTSHADYLMDFYVTVRDADGDFGGKLLVEEPDFGASWIVHAVPTGAHDRFKFDLDISALSGRPSGTVFHLTLQAFDGAGNKSTIWPWMTVPGQSGKRAHWSTAPAGTAPLRIAEVELPAHDIVPAEAFAQSTGTQTIRAYVEGPLQAGSQVKGTAKIVHVITGVEMAEVSLQQVSAAPWIVEGTFHAPECWLGSGQYVVHVMASDSSTAMSSEWWPRLLVK
ncbi:MAG: hypothetical protein JNK78_20805, partial [Planctomycetes bacterium]|nr:hypothetical protein [Planctomycetota bacterium]